MALDTAEPPGSAWRPWCSSRFNLGIRGKLDILSILAVAVFAGCNAPAIRSYHEDLPAYIPDWGEPEARFGYHRAFWTDYQILRPADYFDVGFRVGQKLGPLRLEEGLASTILQGSASFGFQFGLGLDRPTLAVRGSWVPAEIHGDDGANAMRGSFAPSRWWQVTALTGSPHRSEGLGWSAGGRASRLGLGPVLTGEFSSGVLSLRAEVSVAFNAPWNATSDKGTFYNIGIGAAYHGLRR